MMTALSSRASAMLVVALCVCARAGAQQVEIPVQAGITLERDTLTVGQVVRLSVRVRAPRGATINFPAAVDSLGPVQSLEPPSVKDGADTAAFADRIATYRLAAWDMGLQAIRLGDVLVQTDVAERRVALVLPTVFVKSVLPADSTLRIPKPARPLLVAAPPAPWWWWALAALAALVLILLAWWWSLRRGRDAQRTGDPYADAAAAFERVEKLRLVDAGEHGRHAALMTDVLRRYLSDRLEPVSLAQTTSELLVELRDSPTVDQAAVRTLLERVEPVKFGAAPLNADDARGIGDDARAIVRAEHEHAAALAAAEPARTERAA